MEVLITGKKIKILPAYSMIGKQKSQHPSHQGFRGSQAGVITALPVCCHPGTQTELCLSQGKLREGKEGVSAELQWQSLSSTQQGHIRLQWNSFAGLTICLNKKNHFVDNTNFTFGSSLSALHTDTFCSTRREKRLKFNSDILILCRDQAKETKYK